MPKTFLNDTIIRNYKRKNDKSDSMKIKNNNQTKPTKVQIQKITQTNQATTRQTQGIKGKTGTYTSSIRGPVLSVGR